MSSRQRTVLFASAIVFLLLAITAGLSATGIWLWANHHFVAAREALQHHRLVEASAHVRLCLKVWPNSDEAHFIAGRAARRAFDFKQAEKHYRQYQRLLGRTPELVMEETLMRVQQGDVDPSEARFRREVKNHHPESPLILEAFVEGYLRVRRLPDAAACLKMWERLESDNMFFYLLRGSVREAIPNFKDAAADYQKVLGLNPEYAEARMRLARVLLEAHEPAEALPHLAQLRATDPDNAMLLVLQARCYLEMAQPEEAQHLVSEVLSRLPDNLPALLVSAQIAMQDGNHQQAEQRLRRVLAADPYERQANFLLSQVLTQSGRLKEAEEQTARFKRIEEDLKQLHEVFTKKIGAAPHDPAPLYEAGILSLRLGDDKAGIEWLTRALRADPTHEPSRAALAQYYERTGKRQQADADSLNTGRVPDIVPEGHNLSLIPR